jgi:hypothetical protein
MKNETGSKGMSTDTITIDKTGHNYNVFEVARHAWYFEPVDYEGDVRFSDEYPTYTEACEAAVLWDQENDTLS